MSTVFLKKINAVVFYQYGDNSSDVAALGFHASQVGASIEYRY